LIKTKDLVTNWQVMKISKKILRSRFAIGNQINLRKCLRLIWELTGGSC